jgi:hypothetical protein
MTKDEALRVAMDWYGSGNQDPDEFEKLIKAIAAQRTWVGLTYEEESELIRLAHNHAGIRFYIQAAEAKLKELNNA